MKIRTVTILAVFTLTFACAIPSAIADPAKPIKIGVVGAHSGDLACYGLPTLKAAQLIVKDINEQGGINGRPVELLVEDDVCKPEIATIIAAKFVSAGVHAVIGHTCSGPTKAALPIYRAASIPVVSPSATSSSLTQNDEYPNFFRTIAADDAQARTQVDFAINTLKATKIAVIHGKGDYGKDLAEYARNFIAASGRAKVVLFEGVRPGAVDYSAVVQKMTRVSADTVLFGGYHPEASKIVGQLQQKRMTTNFVSDDAINDDTFISVAGANAEGVYATGSADVSKNPLTIEYREKFRQAESTDPGSFFDNAVAATLALTNAIAKAGSTAPKAIIKKLRNQQVDTPFGSISFDNKGEPVGIDFSMYQVRDGHYVQVQ